MPPPPARIDAAYSVSDRAPAPSAPVDPDLRGYLDANADLVTRITKPVSIRDIGALTAQSEQPILFENVIEHPGFRVCDMLVRTRATQGRALGVPPAEYLSTLAYRLRQPPRGLREVPTGPAKEVRLLGDEIDLGRLPIPFHKQGDQHPYITSMNLVRDPETGFCNTSHAGVTVVGRDAGLISFATPHTHRVIRKWRDTGATSMPIAICVGLPPAYEIMANFSGLHMDAWGEYDMFGTIAGHDVQVTGGETVDLLVPAHAEMVIEGYVDLAATGRTGAVTAPSEYRLPRYEDVPRLRVTAVTMRADRPIWRNHQTTPDTDHQRLPRLCHEAVLYNRLRELGLEVTDVQFPTWGAALSVLMQFDYPRHGFVNDALMMAMGAPWLNTKMVVALSPDTDIENPADVYHAIATRVDPARDLVIVPETRGSLYDPSARPQEDHYPFRVVGKIGIDATVKARHDAADFARAWPMNWGDVRLEDYL
jgi:2,5-furandicarboxylate decarboxylase 1